MRCSEVRAMLPELAEGGLREADAVEVHLATCRGCAREMGRYRGLIGGMVELRDALEEPSAGFLERTLGGVRSDVEAADLRRLGPLQRLAENRRVVLSIGGAVVGATAVGLMWWRAARRASPAALGAPRTA